MSVEWNPGPHLLTSPERTDSTKGLHLHKHPAVPPTGQQLLLQPRPVLQRDFRRALGSGQTGSLQRPGLQRPLHGHLTPGGLQFEGLLLLDPHSRQFLCQHQHLLRTPVPAPQCLTSAELHQLPQWNQLSALLLQGEDVPPFQCFWQFLR